MNNQNLEYNSSRIAKNSIFLAVRMVIVMLISFFTTRYLLANLGVEDFGVYNVTLGIVAMCSFLTPALSNANQRYHNYELGKNGIEGAKKVFNTGLLIQLAMILIIVLLAETIGLWYVQEKLVVPEGRENAVFWVYQISILAFAVTMIQIPLSSAILAHERMDFYAFVNVLQAILKLAIAIGIAYATYDKLVIYGLLLLGSNVLALLLYLVYALKHFEETRISLHVDRTMMKSMLSFSGWNLFETIARMGKDLGCNLLSNSFFGPILNAALGVSGQVTYALSSMVDSTVMASRPQMIASYAQGNQHTALSIFYTLSKGVLLIVLILAIPIFLEADYILNLWLGNNVPEYTLELVRISLFIALVDKLASPVTAIVHATGEIKKYHIFSGVINFMVVPLSWIMFLLGNGPLWVYYATLICAVIAQLVFLFIIRNLLPFSIRTYLREVCLPFIRVAVLSVPLPLMLFYSLEQGLSRLCVVTFTAIVVSVILSFFLGLNSKEREVVIKIVKK